ncbi:hypothetical protein PSCLAVI8L_270042 [Pseudoclavibacter sp. 8L]|nr:hypothetical protein PSCLAVI8L_270042 [Pseudoclavibacter sp. 8L]
MANLRSVSSDFALMLVTVGDAAEVAGAVWSSVADSVSVLSSARRRSGHRGRGCCAACQLFVRS